MPTRTALPTPAGTPTPRPPLQFVRVPAFIRDNSTSQGQYISLPDVVRVNEEFELTIISVGSGCERVGDSSVVQHSTLALVFVYDLTVGYHAPDFACAAAAYSFSHEVTLRFSEPGEALILIWGRKSSMTAPGGEPYVIERRIWVQ
jgi:hypothetical protein